MLDADASRTSPGSTPAEACSSAGSWLWVVDAGWMTSERTSPMLATLVCSSRASRTPDRPRRRRRCSNARTAPAPLGAYFWPRSYHGPTAGRRRRPSDLVPGLSHSATFCGVLDVPLHPQRQRLDALRDEEGVERGDRRAEVAQQLHARLEDEGLVDAEGRRRRGPARTPGRCRTGRGVVVGEPLGVGAEVERARRRR